MKNLIIISFLLLVGGHVFGQKVKEVKVKFPQSKQIHEIFYVLKENTSIKHGKYIAYHKGLYYRADLIYETGEYIDGLKEGLWTRNHSPIKKRNTSSCCSVYKKGNYTNGEKTGVWYTKPTRESEPNYFDYDLNKEVQRDPLPRYESIDVNETGCTMNVSVKLNLDCSISDYKVISKYENGFDCSKSDLASIRQQALNIESNSDTCFEVIMSLQLTAK